MVCEWLIVCVFSNFNIPLLLKAMFLDHSLSTLDQYKMGRHNFVVYRTFCEKFIPCVIGMGLFKNSCYIKPFGDYCSVSDEAITFLILENNWDAWVAIGESERDLELRVPLKATGISQKFFGDKKGRGHSWNSRGKREYNSLFENITDDRNEYGDEFDRSFLKTLQSECDEANRNRCDKRKKDTAEEVEVIHCRSDYVPKSQRTNLSLSNKGDASNDVFRSAINRTNI
jgi:hypothetical protein